MRILNLVILYDNENEVIKYAEQLSKQSIYRDIALIIVVNKLGKTQIEKFELKLKNIPLQFTVFVPDGNLGYLNGVIYGYNQFCQIANLMPEWIVVSNTDIEFANNSFFEDFINTNYEDDVWCVAPSVYSPKKNSYDNPGYINRCDKESIDRLIFIHERPLLAYLYAKASKVKGMFLRNKKKESQYIYSGKGCFFILKNEMAEKLKGKKYGALMYSEESYIAEIIRNNNKKIYYDSRIEVIHNENTVTGKLEVGKKAKYIADSLKFIRDEFYR